jgi:hypothetical protein
VTADANSGSGITSVRIEARPSGGTFGALCTDTTSPYACAWDPTALASGSYDLRAVMTQGNGTVVTSATVTVTVDNSVLRAADVQGANGGVLGKPDALDKLVLTFSGMVDPTTIRAGWNGLATTTQVDFKDQTIAGAAIAGYDRAELTGTNLGQVAFPENYVKAGKTVTFTGATMVASTATVNGSQVTVVTITLAATLTGGTNLRSSNVAGVLQWTPTSSLRTPSGASCSTVPAAESGATDKDL